MKIGSRYLYLVITKKPIPTEKLKQLRDGKAHVAKNPVRGETERERRAGAHIVAKLGCVTGSVGKLF